MMKQKDNNHIMKEFRRRKDRQLLAVTGALLLVFFLALVHSRPDLFGQFSKHAIFRLQALVILAFIGFSAFNWRCPKCKTYLGQDIRKSICRKCGTRLR